MRVIEGGITAAHGFTAAGVNCGIKKERNDFCLIASDIPASAAAMFTTNKVAAAPVVFDKEQLQKSPYISVIAANSGVANACTGEQGMLDCRAWAAKTAETLKVKAEQVLVASTGVIGSYVGGFLFSALKIHLGFGSALVEQIVVATVGAIVVVLIARLVA